MKKKTATAVDAWTQFGMMVFGVIHAVGIMLQQWSILYAPTLILTIVCMIAYVGMLSKIGRI